MILKYGFFQNQLKLLAIIITLYTLENISSWIKDLPRISCFSWKYFVTKFIV